jgi:uncharacterized protein
MKTKIILAGGSGFLGNALANYFAAKRIEVIILIRRPKPRADMIHEVHGDGVDVGDWLKELEGSRARINLAGVSVNCRYHTRNRKLMLDSRLNSTRVLGGAKDIFSVFVATEWEREFFQPGSSRREEAHSIAKASDMDGGQSLLTSAATASVRKVALRSAMVPGHAKNSVLPNLLRLGRLGLGGSLAGGRQFVSWIHRADFCRAVEWIIEHENLSGAVNLAAPNPVPNAEFMATIRKACRAPFGLPATRWMLEIGAFVLRTETELLIKSRYVVPGKLLADGFKFHFGHGKLVIQNLSNP